MDRSLPFLEPTGGIAGKIRIARVEIADGAAGAEIQILQRHSE